MNHFWDGFEKRANAFTALGRATIAAPQAVRRGAAAVGRGATNAAAAVSKGVTNVLHAPSNIKNNVVGGFQAGRAQAMGQSIGQYHNAKAKSMGMPLKQYKQQYGGQITAGQKAIASPPMGPAQASNLTGSAQAPAKAPSSGLGMKHLMIAGGIGAGAGAMMTSGGGGMDAAQQGQAFN